MEVKTTPEIFFGTPTSLFPTRVPALTESQVRNTYVPDKNGQRFLVYSRPEEAGAPFTLVLNWSAGLKR